MTLEEMQKQLGGLEATLASLRTENTKLQAQVKQLTDQLQASAAELDQLKAAKVQAQLEADEAVFDGEVKDLLATIPQTGVRERVEARLKAGKDLTERRAIFANIKALHEEMAMPQAKLKAGKNIPDTHDGEHSIDTKLGEQVKAAKAMSAEKGIPYIDALRMVQRKGE